MNTKVFVRVNDYDIDINEITAVHDKGIGCDIYAGVCKIEYYGTRDEFYDLVFNAMSKLSEHELHSQEMELFKVIVVKEER